MVLLVSIDGMRPDGMMHADAPNLHRLFREGASSLTARTVMPSVTLPCHTSMHRGVDVPRHGITSNTFTPLARPVPGILDLAAQHGRRCASFVNWGPLRDLHEPESVQTHFYRATAKRPDGDRPVLEATLAHLDEFDFAFVYFGRTDEVGHRHGWMSEPYLEAIADADRCLGELLDAAAKFSPTVLALADHGGHERGHGTDMPEDMTIPWALWGPGIAPRTLENVRIYDTAPTLAKLMGLPPVDDWDGRPHLE